MLVATVVAIITCLAVANATQTITTPNAAFISYNLAAGASSAAITPATDRSVLVMGCSTTSTNRAVGQVTLLHGTLGSSFISWAGVESNSGTAGSIAVGASNTAGNHIVYIDFGHQTDIRTASADAILIHNGSIATRVGNVTLIW